MLPIKYRHRKALTWSELIDVRKAKGRGKKLVQHEDKVTSKKIAEEAGCTIPKTYYVTKDPSKINFEELPEAYVIKPNHLAAAKQVFLMVNGIDQFTKKPRTTKEIIEKQTQYLKKRINPVFREWATGQIPRRCIVEEYIQVPPDPEDPDNAYPIPTDYKCYLFHGQCCMVRLDYDRRKKSQATDYYTRDFELITCDPIRTKYPRRYEKSEKPKMFDKMIELVEKMGKNFGKFIRIDMYLTPTQVIFGEFTLYPGSGKGSKFTAKTDAYMGALWQKKSWIYPTEDNPVFTEAHFKKVLATLPHDEVLPQTKTKTKSKKAPTPAKSKSQMKLKSSTTKKRRGKSKASRITLKKSSSDIKKPTPKPKAKSKPTTIPENPPCVSLLNNEEES
jgi:hypothetical protein